MNKDFMEFLGCLLKKAFRGRPRGECNLVEFFRGKKKRLVLNRGWGGGGGGLQLLNAIA